MKRYWLVLFKDTFLWMKGEQGLIYNSINFKHFVFRYSETVKTLCDELVDLDNLYSVELTEELLYNAQVKQWVNKIINLKAGQLVEQNGRNKKPISYYPLLSIQNDTKQLLWKNGLGIGGEIIKNIDELIFYINGSPNGSEKYYKQTSYPLRIQESLPFELIESFVKKCGNGRRKHITFIGDLINYGDRSKLLNSICDGGYSTDLVILASDFGDDVSIFDHFVPEENVTISIIVDDYSILNTLLKSVVKLRDRIKWKFPVISPNEVEFVSSFLEDMDLTKSEILPIYNGFNEDFFKKNVFMTEEDFNYVSLSKREIFMNMTLNTNDFGKLIVMPDNKIYANVNENAIGSIDSPIYDMVFEEITDGSSWLNIRNSEPCNDCIYQWLCPSPSNYERVIGKNNLCRLK